MAQEASRERPDKWAWSVGCGLFTLLLGAVALFLPVVEGLPQGGLVGWLLFLAGLIFVANPFASYFPVANVVMAWLLMRGAFVLAMALKSEKSRIGTWLAVSGWADLLLGALLVVGLPVASIALALFGPTLEIIARFSLILAASFLVTGTCQLAIGFSQRGSGR